MFNHIYLIAGINITDWHIAVKKNQLIGIIYFIMSILSANIKKIREKLGLNQTDFAKMIGVETNSAISNWENDKRDPDLNTLKKIAALGEMTLDELLAGEIDKKTSYFDYNTKRMKGNLFPIVAKCYAGEPDMIFQETNIQDYTFFEYAKTEKCFALRVVGDSMTGGNGKSIDNGDIVLIDMDAQILSGDIVLAILNNGRELIKQYQNGKDDIVKLISFNPQYPPIELKEGDVASMYRVMERNKTTKF